MRDSMKTKKEKPARDERVFLVAGAGLEPTAFGL